MLFASARPAAWPTGGTSRHRPGTVRTAYPSREGPSRSDRPEPWRTLRREGRYRRPAASRNGTSSAPLPRTELVRPLVGSGRHLDPVFGAHLHLRIVVVPARAVIPVHVLADLRWRRNRRDRSRLLLLDEHGRALLDHDRRERVDRRGRIVRP